MLKTVVKQPIEDIECTGCVSNKHLVSNVHQCYCTYWKKEISYKEQCTAKEINTLLRRLKLLWYRLTISNYHAIDWSRERLLKKYSTKYLEIAKGDEINGTRRGNTAL